MKYVQSKIIEMGTGVNKDKDVNIYYVFMYFTVIVFLRI